MGSDLIYNLNSLGCLTPLSLANSPVANIRTPVTIISNMASSSPRKTVTITPRSLLSSSLTIKPSSSSSGGSEKLSFITIKNPDMEKKQNIYFLRTMMKKEMGDSECYGEDTHRHM